MTQTDKGWLARYFGKFGGNDKFRKLDYFEIRTFILEEIEQVESEAYKRAVEVLMEGIRNGKQSIYNLPLTARHLETFVETNKNWEKEVRLIAQAIEQLTK